MSAVPKLSVRYAYDLPLGKGSWWPSLEEALEHQEANAGYDLFKLYATEAGRVVHHERVEVTS